MRRVIDGHTHIFNVGFLPVQGILMARGVPKWLANRTTRVLERLLERERVRSLAGDEERFMTLLESEIRAPSEPRTLVGRDDWFARYADAIPRSRIEELRDILPPEIERDFVPEMLEQARREAGLTGGNEDEDVRRRVELLFRQTDAIAGPVETGGDEARLLGPGLKGIMKWLSLLVQHESRIVEAFPDAWASGEEMAAQVHIMMDMELHYRIYDGRPPVYDFKTEQIRRMREVTRYARIPLIGLAAFDPFKDTDEGLAIVQDAFANGFAGVKFYPPNGYKPVDNEDGDIEGGPSAKIVNARNMAFFRWCVAEDVPIFTHCTDHGVESRRGVTGHFSHPDHWETVLKTDGLQKLRLCLGHAGGQEAWTAAFDSAGEKIWSDSYAKKVVELCAKENVYCDFGYFDALLEGGGMAFTRRLEWVFKNNPGFERKCCYGTDWHLMIVQKHAPRYPRIFREALEASPAVLPHVDDFMYGNVSRFLRIDDFLAREGSATTG